jgi:membrane protein implicated in regulation of membrane protease activity
MLVLFGDCGLICNWVIDHIPVWVYVVIIIGGTGALFYFFSPILVPLWNLTPRWVKVAGGAILSVILAALAGRYRGRKDAEEEQKKRDAEAIANRNKVNEDVEKLSPTDQRKRLDGWVRDE